MAELNNLSFSPCLLSTYHVPGTGLGVRDMRLPKLMGVLPSLAYSLGVGDKQINIYKQ